MNVTAGSGSRRGLGSVSIIDPTKSTMTNINGVGAMFDKDGKPVDSKKWVRPSQATTNNGVAGSEVTSQTGTTGLVNTQQMLNNIKNDVVNEKEANMAGLGSVGRGFTGKGLGVAGAGVAQTPVVGQVVTPNVVTTKPNVVVGGGVAGQAVAGQQATNNTIIKPGSKVIVANPTGTPGVIQNGATIIANNGVVAGAGTPDQKLANAKRNAGKLINKLLEMAYGLTEQEEKYLIELMDSIGMKETFLSAAGLGSSTPINAQVVLNAINEMNQVMVANANITSSNIELANSIYGKLDTLTMEAQAGGYNEADLIAVLAELYASGMINTQDASKPNLVFCFNTLKTQVERLVGGVQPVQTNVGVARPVNTGVQTAPVVTTATTTQQTGGKMFTRPQNQITNRFNTTVGVGSGLNLDRGTFGGSGLSTYSRTSIGVGGQNLVQTQVGANNLRTNIAVPAVGSGLSGGVSVRGTTGQAYFNAANQEPNYSGRAVGQVGVSGGFMGSTIRAQGIQTGGVVQGGVVARPNVGGAATIQGGYNSVVQGGGAQSPIMQYMSM